MGGDERLRVGVARQSSPPIRASASSRVWGARFSTGRARAAASQTAQPPPASSSMPWAMPSGWSQMKASRDDAADADALSGAGGGGGLQHRAGFEEAGRAVADHLHRGEDDCEILLLVG